MLLVATDGILFKPQIRVLWVHTKKGGSSSVPIAALEDVKAIEPGPVQALFKVCSQWVHSGDL